jgi:small subunit ribosomal protein S4
MSRREGYALHPKAHKALVKRSALPGQNAQSRGRRSSNNQYSLQLREKQKVKRLYGLLEKQFSNLMKEANRRQGQSGEVLLQLLEQRADNVIYRAGFAPSRSAARQMVSHGHIVVNGKKVTVPSYEVSVGDTVMIREGSKNKVIFSKLDEDLKNNKAPAWLSINSETKVIKIEGVPSVDTTELLFDVKSVLEFYTR